MANTLWLISVSIITRDRTDELEAVLQSIEKQHYPEMEILVGDNGSQAENLEVIRRLVAKTPRTRLLEFGRNLGVSGGRNAVLAECQGEFVVEVDDDGLLAHPEVFAQAVHRMNQEANIGILAFKVVNYHTRKIDRQEFPFLTKRRDPELAGDTSWFIGCGHFFRRSMINAIGDYREFFPYGSEELDYAFRALDAGFRIVYDPRLVVLHKKSLKHRIVDPVQWGTLALKHRVKVALLNLPWPFCLSYMLVRGLQFSGWLRHPQVISRAIKLLWAEREYIRATRRGLLLSTLYRVFRLRGPRFF